MKSRMKPILGAALAALLTGSGTAAANDAEVVSSAAAIADPECNGPVPRIHVSVTNVEREEGVVVVDLYDDNEERFLKGKHKLARVRMPANGPYAQLCFSGVAPGLFGVAVYHDRNDNRSFDKNFIGLPAEPWGLSTNPGFKPRAPRFEDAGFEAGPGQTEIVVQLHH